MRAPSDAPIQIRRGPTREDVVPGRGAIRRCRGEQTHERPEGSKEDLPPQHALDDDGGREREGFGGIWNGGEIDIKTSADAAGRVGALRLAARARKPRVGVVVDTALCRCVNVKCAMQAMWKKSEFSKPTPHFSLFPTSY
jgi:hypothetical protein